MKNNSQQSATNEKASEPSETWVLPTSLPLGNPPVPLYIPLVQLLSSLELPHSAFCVCVQQNQT